MGLIIATLLPLIILTLISIFIGDEPLGLDWRMGHLGLHSDVDLGIRGFSIDPIEGAIIFLITIVALASTVGIHILASGLAETSVRVLINIVIYVGLWGVLSMLASPLIFGIAVFGGLIYVLLTLGYTIGVIQKILEG